MIFVFSELLDDVVLAISDDVLALSNDGLTLSELVRRHVSDRVVQVRNSLRVVD